MKTVRIQVSIEQAQQIRDHRILKQALDIMERKKRNLDKRITRLKQNMEKETGIAAANS